MVLVLRRVAPKRSFFVGYNLDGVKMLRYECTSSTFPPTGVPTNWTVILSIEKVGKRTYAVKRTSTNWTIGGSDATFTLDEKGDFREINISEMTKSGEGGTGGLVSLTVNEAVNGSGFFQEFPPLPGEAISLGDAWMGTSHISISSRLSGAPNALVTVADEDLRCKAVHRNVPVQVPAGEFSVLEVMCDRDRSIEMYTVLENGTTQGKSSLGVVPSKTTYFVDEKTGIVVSTTWTGGDESMRGEIAMVLVELVRG
jgi:hypothetical protein